MCDLSCIGESVFFPPIPVKTVTLMLRDFSCINIVLELAFEVTSPERSSL